MSRTQEFVLLLLLLLVLVGLIALGLRA